LAKQTVALVVAYAVTAVCCVVVASATQIDRIACSHSPARIDMLISASEPITSFQKPERQGSQVIIRIPQSSIASHAVDTTCITKDFSIVTEQIRTFAVIKITARQHQGEVLLQRSGANQLALSIESKSQLTGEKPQLASEKPKSEENWKLDVVVIDAGHGGVDAGAIGVNGVREKDVTLAIAKKLRDLVRENFPDTKVVMTRDTDTFIELYKRTQIANEAKGKLFISIHCNSMPTKPHPAHGCETYILRPGRNADAASVAARENASINFERSKDRYANLTEDNLIVATMAQRTFVRFSEELASEVGKAVAANTPLKNRGVNQAGFYVLVGASMPNILFETAFLSNTDDAAYVSSAKGQTELATSMMKAIKAYVKTYEKAASK